MMSNWCNKYCCENMELAVESWGGVWWDEEKEAWFVMREYRDGFSNKKEIVRCPWCDMPLPEPPESEE